MKILYHHRTQGRGAEGVHISSIVNALNALGHQVTIISPAGVDPLISAGDAPVDKSSVKTQGVGSFWKFISKHLPNFMFEIAEIGYNLVALRSLERELRANQYDAIYERYAFFMIAGAIKAAKYNIPLILEANEVSGINDRARKQTFKRLCDRFELFLFKRCSSIHTVSSYLKNMIVARGISQNSVLVTPNAIDPNKFSKKPNNDLLLKKYQLSGKIVLGFAGWFDDWDRLDLLLDVFHHLSSSNDNLALLLVGDGEVLNPLRQKITQLSLDNKVVLTGAVARSEVQDYLAMLDIAVITHSNEFGSPVVMFEFMGLKVPIVAPKLLPITDVLVDEESALLFDVLDMKQLELKLTKLISEPRLMESLANSSYKKLMSEHTWTSNALHIVDCILKK